MRDLALVQRSILAAMVAIRRFSSPTTVDLAAVLPLTMPETAKLEEPVAAAPLEPAAVVVAAPEALALRVDLPRTARVAQAV
jgi:hypothetical protein